MADNSVPPLLLLRQANNNTHQQEEEEEPDQQSISRPFFEPVDSLTQEDIFSRNNINHVDEDDDVLVSDFCSACLDTLYYHISASSDSDCDSDSAFESDSNLNCFRHDYEENDFMDLDIGDLCVSCREDQFSMSDGQISNSPAFDDEVEEERLGFGLDRSVVAPVRGESSTTGLRVAGIDSESDSELVIDDVNGEEQLGNTLFWDCLGFEEQISNNGELDWEEIEERVVDEREGLRSVIDRIEEMSVSSDLSRYDEMNEIPEDDAAAAAEESLEWEVLVEMVNWDRPRMHEFEAEEEVDDDDDDNDSYLAVHDDYTTDGGENITDFLHQFTRDSNVVRGSPPTAEHVRKNLPCVVLTVEELQKENLNCAVCKDGIVVDEKVTMLPCNHHYHFECIVPWLNVRNTCPLCRYELPTDDMDYEMRRNQEGGVGLGGDSEDGYNYEWLV
ncbi:E3 ubiquitin-protein ligase Praja-2-like [Impatiens glandulifera]|uniref:E3 ubiquitin-protein ligase Praja-2-like n=1 Tax=Impatiens glandulifera TaxID=253017 RepID=UPI001FB0C930|nr:E3 ubiquitin-protein ligase Praja-2-like [Impatiens glandulifera]